MVVQRVRSWWPKVKQHPAISVLALVVLIAGTLFILAIYSFGWDWTGFTSAVGPVLRPDEQYRPTKTLWDFLQLLVVPVMLAVGGFWLNQIQKKREERTTEQRVEAERKIAEQRVEAERKIAEQRTQLERETAEKRVLTEREIAQDNQREAALQAYIDKISELLLHEKLRESEPGDEVRSIARVRTLTVLPRLDKERKRSVVQFLQESGLIDKDKHIVALNDADLRKADLSDAQLAETDLHETNLSNADLTGANLSGSDLSGANLNGAKLTEANLSDADLHRVDLTNTFLGNNNLHVNLSRALLRGVDLSGANLEAANLSYASLRGTDLRDAILQDTDLRGADL